MTRRRRWSRSRIARRVLRWVRAFSGHRAVPLVVIRVVRAIGTGTSPLAPKSRAASARTLRSEPLRRLLDGVELGTWALGPKTIDELVRMIDSGRPASIIEFGSGSSTVALAWAMHEAWGSSTPPRILSIEQDAAQAERTRGLLASAGLDREAVVLVAPLEDQILEGRHTKCYALPAALDALGGRAAELVLIDGPAGAAGVRFGTIPLVRPYVRDGAQFVLDDALRDGELDIARAWARLSYTRVAGIRLIEKGLLVGTVRSR